MAAKKRKPGKKVDWKKERRRLQGGPISPLGDIPDEDANDTGTLLLAPGTRRSVGNGADLNGVLSRGRLLFLMNHNLNRRKGGAIEERLKELFG